MMRTKTILTLVCAALMPLAAADLVAVVSRPVSRSVELPGEIEPYLSVPLHARVAGYVEKVLVDRGSLVKQGQLLVELSAPELESQIAERESRLESARSSRLEADARLSAATATWDRLKQAAATPGAIAANELVQAEKQVEAARALVRQLEQAAHAAEASVRASRDTEAYLRITAPFDGVVTERRVHPGALVGPGADAVLLVIEQLSRLRLVVAVPEEHTGAIARGARVEFRAPAYPGRVFTGSVARLAHVLDPKTRTMAVELDVANREGLLAPGMYPAVRWPVRRERPALLVPKTSVVTTTERTFVIRERAGRAEWVDVKKGAAEGELVEVLGALQPGDRVVRRATDEVRDGSALASSR